MEKKAPITSAELLAQRAICIGTEEFKPNNPFDRRYVTGAIVEMHDWMIGHEHLFKPIPWWAYRDATGFPEYAKRRNGKIVQVTGWENLNEVTAVCVDKQTGQHYMAGLELIEPSSFEDYTNQNEPEDEEEPNYYCGKCGWVQGSDNDCSVCGGQTMKQKEA